MRKPIRLGSAKINGTNEIKYYVLEMWPSKCEIVTQMLNASKNIQLIGSQLTLVFENGNAVYNYNRMNNGGSVWVGDLAQCTYIPVNFNDVGENQITETEVNEATIWH